MDANELGRWTRFAAKGGIGNGTALHDCVAEQEDDLMFLQGDEITILMQLPGRDDIYLGHCEGVVGRFHGQDVRFHAKLKKPVMTKRSSTAHPSSRPSSSLSAITQGGRDSVPLFLPSTSPSLPPHSHNRTPSTFSTTAVPYPALIFPPPSSNHHPHHPPFLPPQPSAHLRSISHSSISTALDSASIFTNVDSVSTATALDSAPRTPADFSISKDELLPDNSPVRILSLLRPSESPDDLDADTTISAVDPSIIASDDPPTEDPPKPIPPILSLSEQRQDDNDSFLSSTTTKTERPEDQEPSSYLESESSARFSRISGLSDGEVGIGLSLLQDFLNGVGEDSDSQRSSRSSYHSQVISRPSTLDLSSPNVHQAESGIPVLPPVVSPTSPSFDHGPRPHSQSPVPPFVREATSRSSTQPSVTDSDYGGGEEWEGASDIYDNYRYSRLSMASKMSRFSKGSMHTVASGFGIEVPLPPVPTDAPPRASLDSVAPGRSRMGSLADSAHSKGVRESVDSAAAAVHASSVEPQAPIIDVKVIPEPLERKKPGEGWKHVPSPLTFPPEITSSPSPGLATSPLLHTTFASPLGSPSAHSTNAFLSPTPSSPTFPSAIGGVATALRQRLEMERAASPGSGSQRGISPSPSTLSDDRGTAPSVNRLSTQPIVQDDDDDDDDEKGSGANTSDSAGTPPSLARSRESGSHHEASSPNSPSSPSVSPTTVSASTESAFVSEKQALQSSIVVVNPPPPYTPLAATSETSVQSEGRSTSASQSSMQARVPAAVVRPLNMNRSPSSPAARTSLFMPHPHAPKPTLSPTGPMYGRTPPPVSPLSPAPTGPLPGSLMHTLSVLYAHRFEQGHMRRTLYAKLEQELSHSVGPVPISFSLEPPQSIPANRPNRGGHQLQGPPFSTASAVASTAAPPNAMADTASGPGSNKVIPRANFFPKIQTPRPRSRSFSGFDASTVPVEAPKQRSSEESHPPATVQPQALSKRSKSASAVVATPPKPSVAPAPGTSPRSGAMANGSPTSRPASHRPSPLSLSHNNVVAPLSSKSPSNPKPPPPPSPLSRPPITAPPPPVSSLPSLNEGRASSPPSPGRLAYQPSLGQAMSPPPSPLAASIPTASTTIASPPMSEPSRSLPLVGSSSIGTAPARVPSRSLPVIRHSRSSLSGRRISGRETSPSRSSLQGRQSGETDSDGRSVTSPSAFGGSPPSSGPLGRNGSLRSKLSLPTLRMRNSERSLRHESQSPTSSISPSVTDPRTVQIKDTDFELVKPVAVQVLNSPKDDSFPPSSPINPASSLSLRTGSPATSRPRPDRDPASPIEASDVEAHRQRELRWISTMASVPPGQSRKNKKIRKLLQEGVPASVRYLVWAHLTDSKSKRMDGLYARLGKRERVAAAASIEKDVQRCFINQPELQDGSLVNLLQAYLTMVPDIQYSRGLTAIAGCLLMQSPEEDAFWTFISLMDTHLRSYFSPASIQLEVDASLFGKALESNEPVLVKKVFVDMALSPATICRPWFSCLFVHVLPTEHLHRVWDIFLFEGVSFLFRIGLAIFTCCKQAIMATAGRDAVFDILMHPPPICLPAAPDALLDIAFSMRLKDGDLQKQRHKMEAQLKRSTQSSRSLLPQGSISVSTPAISLPKS